MTERKPAPKKRSPGARGGSRKAAPKAASPPRSGEAGGEEAVQAKIAALPGPYRELGERLHAIITASAPDLVPRLWYGMPAYAKEGNVICFFRGGPIQKERYMTLGFLDRANLDEGALWPVAFAIQELTADAEARIAALVRKSVS